jgi:hypothetical protein
VLVVSRFGQRRRASQAAAEAHELPRVQWLGPVGGLRLRPLSRIGEAGQVSRPDTNRQGLTVNVCPVQGVSTLRFRVTALVDGAEVFSSETGPQQLWAEVLEAGRHAMDTITETGVQRARVVTRESSNRLGTLHVLVDALEHAFPDD